jgi:hypothetical protein
MHRPKLLTLALLVVTALFAAAAGAAGYRWSGDGGSWYGDRDQGAYDQPRRDSGNSWYGPSREYRDENTGRWAVGTYHGQNGANGNEETITIRPDGTAELRTRGEAPQYGTFAGETLTVGSRISKVEPARGGIVIDGAYYRR